jgi:hypothetical protein
MKQREGIMRKLSIAVVAAAFTFVAAGCENDTPELIERPEPAAEENGLDVANAADADDAEDADGEGSGEGAEIFELGDTVAMGDLEHTLHGARWSEGDEWYGPDEGERWLVVDIELTNTGGGSESISSLLMWTLVDADNRSLDVTFTGDERGSLDGELGSGRSMRGEAAFSVADSEDQWELVFEPNLFGFGQAIYVIDDDDVDDN